ncbi:hypothetical protein EKO27_g1560 [Xylaria grammica]|uniref:Rhomboid family membrane protein n=1 Tax=Xylaria grammica TaxID=363999 RepID=A0A439DGP6_9PEZI|nr:hypothetical protein EKO27_g1560 [Xylaria grammica]
MASSASAPAIPPPSAPSESQSQLQTPTRSTDQYNNKNPLIHTVALGVTPLALIALCLPPRRLDLRAAMLGGVALWGTNQLAHDYSGKSFTQRFSSRMASFTGTELPEKAKETQARIREEKERKKKLRALREEMIRSGAAPGNMEAWSVEQKRALLQAYERSREKEVGEDKKGILEKVWMGDAAPDWREKRDQREKEALQEGGGGYLGLITDQIFEVWNGGKRSEEDVAKEKTSGDAKDP